MIITFWILLTLIFYCYFAYPLFLAAVARLASTSVQKGAYEPHVSVVLSVWNEEDVIERKMRNLLSLDYPVEELDFWIGSDGSTDQTEEILSNIRDPRVHLIANAERRGKMATINALVEATRRPPAEDLIIVFTDARQIFEASAIRELVANFADPAIGCVSGELIFKKKEGEGGTARGVNLYWNYEKFLRSQESKIHSMLGATGAIYAIRRELFEQIPVDIVLDDMYVPLKIIQKGYRAIFDESAKAYDHAADSPREEHRRKARTLFGNYQIFGVFPDMFNPLRSPIAIQLFSHKLLRVIAPFLMIALFTVNVPLTAIGFYRLVFIFQVLFYAMAITGALSRHRKHGIFKLISKVCYVPYVFCLLNFSALSGFIQFITKKQEVTWEKARMTQGHTII
jgi:cellulose synthase/poly-beta-1,6-N-acetylglucosamine synthase-like glycosyltransferase